MKPLVTIIMSTLNTKEEYLITAIESILRQTYVNLEFIIIVDGGNDDVIINKINDNRIKIIKHENSMGLAASLNEAIEISNGKYIARMDSDDISLPTRINTQVEYMEANKDIDITATYYTEIGKSKKKVLEKFTRPEEVKAKLFYVNIILHPSVMFRKQFLDKYKIKYDENYIYSQDFELWTRINKNSKIAIIPKIEMNYRVHDAQISSSKLQKQSELYYKVLVRNLKQLNIGQENLKYLLMLNSREKNIEVQALENFVKIAINNNRKIQLYDDNIFEIVLKTALIKSMIKRRRIFNMVFIKNLKYLVYIF